MEYRLTIKEMPEELRPRERMLKAGPHSLSNSELLAILLRTGSRKESALDLASRILKEKEGLQFLADAALEELVGIQGVGLAKAAQIKAAVELGKRLAAYKGEQRFTVESPASAANLLMDEMRFLDREHFRAILLNTKNHVLGTETISIGSLNSSIVHPRELFKQAIKKSAAALILAHNHPSGDPTPSREDVEVTKRLLEAGKIIGIEILDHLVIGNGIYVSFKERGLI
ncbi:RadC family protein [Zhaonella formicivorans]|uniref:RadC family protein n=1 Tax=Zhaonella formicivorans TaxID=2528593 RepID=UPI0010F05FA8|nr:DNA repair protein RadC [Zhaonella formicivorans]